MIDGPAQGARVRTVFLGSGGFGVASLGTLVDDPSIDVVGVVTAPARPVGRRQIVTPTPIEAAARAAGIPTILTPERLRAPEAIEAVLALRPGLAVLTDYGQIVPAALLDLGFGALNLHPSLLPRYRGAIPIPATILAGDEVTGVTLMRMDAGLDSGPIVATVTTAVAPAERAPGLEARLAILAATLLADSLGPWLRGERPAHPQPAEGASLTRPLRRADARLDPMQPAVALERRIRAYDPWPGTFIETVEGRLAVLRAEVGPADGRPAGTLTHDGLVAADGLLRFLEVQPAGGTPMAWAAYRLGHPGVIGSVLVPPS